MNLGACILFVFGHAVSSEFKANAQRELLWWYYKTHYPWHFLAHYPGAAGILEGLTPCLKSGACHLISDFGF
ncbi:HAD family hydrolase [Nostoc sp.]